MGIVGMMEDSLGTERGKGQASVSSAGCQNTQFTYILAYSTLNTTELFYPKNTFFSFLSFFKFPGLVKKQPDCIEPNR